MSAGDTLAIEADDLILNCGTHDKEENQFLCIALRHQYARHHGMHVLRYMHTYIMGMCVHLHQSEQQKSAHWNYDLRSFHVLSCV